MNSIITRIGAVATTMKKTLTDYVTAKDIANWAVTKAQMHVYEFYEDKERRKQENPYAFMFSLDGMDRTFKTREKVERTVMIAEGYRILRMAGWIAGISFLTTTHKPDNELYAYICASAATVEFAAAYAMHIGQRKVAPFVERMRKKHGRKTIDNIFTDDINDTFNAFYNVDPILKVEGSVRALRLALTDLTASVLKVGAELLTLRVPERM